MKIWWKTKERWMKSKSIMSGNFTPDSYTLISVTWSDHVKYMVSHFLILFDHLPGFVQLYIWPLSVEPTYNLNAAFSTKESMLRWLYFRESVEFDKFVSFKLAKHANMYFVLRQSKTVCGKAS